MATLNSNWQKIGEAYVGNTNGTLDWWIRIYAKLNSQNTANNTSSISYESRLYGAGSGSYFYSSSDTSKTISGTNLPSSVESANGTYYKGETTLQTRTVTVPHNEDGTKTISANANFYAGPWGFNATASGSATVPRINRYAVTRSVTGSNVEENFSVNYTKYVDTYKYKLRISIPNVKTLETINYNTSDESFKLSSTTVNELFDTYGPLATFNLGFAVETWNNGDTSKLSDGNETLANCMTDSKGRIRINGEWKNATPYVRQNGEWKRTIPHIRINNEWKRGK